LKWECKDQKYTVWLINWETKDDMDHVYVVDVNNKVVPTHIEGCDLSLWWQLTTCISRDPESDTLIPTFSPLIIITLLTNIFFLLIVKFLLLYSHNFIFNHNFFAVINLQKVILKKNCLNEFKLYTFLVLLIFFASKTVKNMRI
jgi:hypothetical protein